MKYYTSGFEEEQLDKGFAHRAAYRRYDYLRQLVRQMPPDKKIADFRGVQIYKKDFQSLEPNGWLTDTIISFVYAYLDNFINIRRLSQRIKLVRPSDTQILQHGHLEEAEELVKDFDQYGFVFLPLNEGVQDSERQKRSESAGGAKTTVSKSEQTSKPAPSLPQGDHWTLLVLNTNDNKAFYFNSKKLANDEKPRHFIDRLNVVTKRPILYERLAAPTQSNDSDSGVIVCGISALLVRRIIPSSSGKRMSLGLGGTHFIVSAARSIIMTMILGLYQQVNRPPLPSAEALWGLLEQNPETGDARYQSGSTYRGFYKSFQSRGEHKEPSEGARTVSRVESKRTNERKSPVRFSDVRTGNTLQRPNESSNSTSKRRSNAALSSVQGMPAPDVATTGSQVPARSVTTTGYKPPRPERPVQRLSPNETVPRTSDTLVKQATSPKVSPQPASALVGPSAVPRQPNFVPALKAPTISPRRSSVRGAARAQISHDQDITGAMREHEIQQQSLRQAILEQEQAKQFRSTQAASASRQSLGGAKSGMSRPVSRRMIRGVAPTALGTILEGESDRMLLQQSDRVVVQQTFTPVEMQAAELSKVARAEGDPENPPTPPEKTAEDRAKLSRRARKERKQKERDVRLIAFEADRAKQHRS